MNKSKEGITAYIFYDNYHPKENGKCAVKICVTHQRKRIYIPSGIDLTNEEWARLSNTKSTELRKKREGIDSLFNRIWTKLEEQISNESINIDLLKKNSFAITSINQLFDEKITELEKEDRIGSKDYYMSARNIIARYYQRHVQVNEITPEWLYDFEKKLQSNQLSRTTIAMYLRALRHIISRAIDKGLLNKNKYPFGKGLYEIKEGEGRKMALTIEQIGSIAKYESSSPLYSYKHRDLWLFSYMCNGINIIDLIQLRKGDIKNGEICFIRQKIKLTAKRERFIKAAITEPMQKIIDKWGCKNNTTPYIFPFLNGSESNKEVKRKAQYLTKAINVRMANITKELNLPHISTYTARHSFATVLKRSGTNIAYISESLGHSNLSTTEAYLDSFETEERRKNANLLTLF